MATTVNRRDTVDEVPGSTNPFGEPPADDESTNPFGEPSTNPFENEEEDENYNPFLNPDSTNVQKGPMPNGQIVMSDGCAELFQTDKSDREVQIEFLIKEIQKARVKGNNEKADMVQQVLDEFLQE